MTRDMVVEAKAPGALDDVERAAWVAFRAARPELASPCFDLRFILVAARAAPGAEVAVLRRDGGVEGFLPFQRRGGLIQPLGAPLSDYHGLILRPGAEVCLAEVVERLNVRRFRFGGLIGAPPTEAEGETRPAMVADLSEGYEAYLESRRAAGTADFLKTRGAAPGCWSSTTAR
jgi:CelD/BcsL family acetyltransferase involved in cellulose biosynthesis